MTNLRATHTLSVLLVFAALTSHYAQGQASVGVKNNDYWCRGSALGGIANSGSKFTVKVSSFVSTDLYQQFHHERPIGAVKVVLLTDSQMDMDREISAITDGRGIAEFADVPSGAYTVHIDGARFWESQVQLTVDALKGTPTEIPLLWPQRAYVVRHVRGWLMDGFTGML